MTTGPWQHLKGARSTQRSSRLPGTAPHGTRTAVPRGDSGATWGQGGLPATSTVPPALPVHFRRLRSPLPTHGHSTACPSPQDPGCGIPAALGHLRVSKPAICAIKSSGSGAAPNLPKTITEPRAPRSTNRRLGVPQAPTLTVKHRRALGSFGHGLGSPGCPTGVAGDAWPCSMPRCVPPGAGGAVGVYGMSAGGEQGQGARSRGSRCWCYRISRAREVTGTGPGTTPGCVCPAHRGLEMAGGATRAPGCARRELLPRPGWCWQPLRG